MSTRTKTMIFLALCAPSCLQRHGSAPALSIMPPAPVTDSARIQGTRGPWVILRRTVRSGIPDIDLDTPQLPALSADGGRVLVPETEAIGPESTQNLSLVIRRVGDESVVLSIPILNVGELDPIDLRKSEEQEGADRALEELVARIEARMERANDMIGQEPWIPLSKCWTDDTRSDGGTCVMEAQNISCGAILMAVYRDRMLEVWDREHSARLPRPRWAPPTIKIGPDFATLRECFDGTWIAPEEGLLVGKQLLACDGGDWCSRPSVWRIVVLPFRPKPAPPPRAPAGGAACPNGMREIPAGAFTMGASDGFGNEQTPHWVEVPAFCLDTTEVRVADYAACVDARWCFIPSSGSACNFGVAGKGRHPINCVTAYQAEGYCSWVGKRLPSEAEWEYAARGPGGKRYPFGNDVPGDGVCWRPMQSLGTCPTGASLEDLSHFGILDMAGNVAEWAARTSSPDPEDTESRWPYVQRGGSWWSSDPHDLRGAQRYESGSTLGEHKVGFRCAVSRAR